MYECNGKNIDQSQKKCKQSVFSDPRFSQFGVVQDDKKTVVFPD